SSVPAAPGTATRRISEAERHRGTSERKPGLVGEPGAQTARRSTAAIARLYAATAHAAPAIPSPGTDPAPKMTSGETGRVARPPAAPAGAGSAALPPPRRTLAAALKSQNGTAPRNSTSE